MEYTVLYVKIWKECDFTDVNSGRASDRILLRMLFMEFHRRRRLSEFSEITSANIFRCAFVLIL